MMDAEQPLHQLQAKLVGNVPLLSASKKEDDQLGVLHRLLWHGPNASATTAAQWMMRLPNPVPVLHAFLGRLCEGHPPPLLQLCAAHQISTVQLLQQLAVGSRGAILSPLVLQFMREMCQVLCANDGTPGVDSHIALRLRLALLATEISAADSVQLAERLVSGKAMPAWLHATAELAEATEAMQMDDVAVEPTAPSLSAMLTALLQHDAAGQRLQWLAAARMVAGTLPQEAVELLAAQLDAAAAAQLYATLSDAGCSYQEVAGLMCLTLWPHVVSLEGSPPVELLSRCKRAVAEHYEAFSVVVLHPALGIRPLKAGQAELLQKIVADVKEEHVQAALGAFALAGGGGEAEVAVLQALLASKPAFSMDLAGQVVTCMHQMAASMSSSAKLAKTFLAVLQCAGINPELQHLREAAELLSGAGKNVVLKKLSGFAP